MNTEIEKSSKLTETHSTVNILVVDDDEVTLEIVKAYLQKFYTITTATSGKFALELLKRKSFDLVLLDYMMPEMDGPTVFQHIKEDFSELNVPIVFLTGVSDKELVIRGLKLLPKDYLLKPVQQIELLERVSKVLLGL